MKREPRRTPLKCKNGHRYSGVIEWVDLRGEEQYVPDWRPITEGVFCKVPNCGAPIEVDRSQTV
jgi:hypothetical protein